MAAMASRPARSRPLVAAQPQPPRLRNASRAAGPALTSKPRLVSLRSPLERATSV